MLFVSTWLWAWSQKTNEFERHQDQQVRQAEFLARGLAIVVEQFDAARPGNEARFREAVQAHLRLNPPILFAIVQRGPEVIVQVGDAPPALSDALRPGLDEARDLFVVRTALTDPSRAEHRSVPPQAWNAPPPDVRESPWEWSPGVSLSNPEAEAAPLQLYVGLPAGLPAHVMRTMLARIGAVLVLAWAAIAALALAWSRSIRSRDLAASLEIERRERARLGEMNLAAAGLAHETKNPLGLILGLAQQLSSDPTANARVREKAEQIVDAADRATAQLSDFINFARIPEPRIVEVSASEIFKRVTSALQPDFDAAGVRLVLPAAELRFECDPAMFEQILINLLLNSLQASPSGTTTTVRLARDGAIATLIVSDQGRGIPPELAADIFKPYVTGRVDGHGLGLAIVKRIVEHHGWAIAVSSEVGQGATVSIAGIRVVDHGS